MGLPLVPHLPARNDKSSCGQFHFVDNDVHYGDDGITGLRKYVTFDLGDWFRQDVGGACEYLKVFDTATSHGYERLKPAAAGTFDLFRNFQIPRDFGRSGIAPVPEDIADPEYGFFPPGALTLMTFRSGAITSAKLSLLSAGAADSGVNAVDVSPSGSGAWQLFTFSPADLHLPGQFCALQLELIASGAVEFSLKNLSLGYISSRGNI